MRKAALPLLAGVEFLDEIGRGAHAIVYLARKGDRKLAVKVQREPHPGEAARFRREAALLACMRHPALPNILDVGEVDGRPWLVMDYAEGRNLAQILTEGPLAEERIVAIARDLAGALAEVHGHGLVHRDVKPENVLITPEGSARLLDFGLATRMRDERDADGEVAGTFLYAAPEQTGLLKRPVDGRSDLYALGALLFECATGHPPFRASDVGELVRQHAVKPVPDLGKLRPDLSPVLVRIVTRLLAKDPDDRYQSGKGLLADLVQIRSLEEARDAAVLGALDGPQVLFETPVVGYELELDLLWDCWKGVCEGHGGAVLVEGPAGYGKSRLLREMMDAVRKDGDVLVLRARCIRGDPAPFGVLRDAVDAWLRRTRLLPPAVREETERKVVAAAGEMAPLLRRFSPTLATFLPEGEVREKEGSTQEPFYQALARFLVALADAHGGALFALDDVEWLDDASREVLTRLAPQLSGTRMLLVAAGNAAEPGFQTFVHAVGEDLALRIQLRGLGLEATRALISHHLGGGDIPDELLHAVATRAQGAPFAVVEFVAALLDAGLLTPAWSSWNVDVEGLERLALPTDVTELIAQRVDALRPSSLPVLRVAAVWGARFDGTALVGITGATAEEVQAALDEAIHAHLLERVDRHLLSFVHERVRAALIAQLTEDQRRAIHREIASWLSEREGSDPEAIFVLARHLALGGGDPARVHEANLRAGRLALRAYANDEARQFLDNARKAALQAGLPGGAELEEALGIAAARAGRFREALTHYEAALAASPSALLTARVHAQMAEVRLALLDTGEAWRSIEAGFRALRRPYPDGSLASWVITLFLACLGTLLHVLRVGGGGTSAERREKHELLAHLSNLGNRLGYLDGNVSLLLQMTLVPLYSVHRLGVGRELVDAYSSQALVLSRMGERRLARHLAEKATSTARKLRDRVLVARAALHHAMALHIQGDALESDAAHRRNLEDNAAWIDAGDYLLAANDLAHNLLLRGHAEMAWITAEKALLRGDRREVAQGHPITCTAAIALAMMGRSEEAAAWLHRSGVHVGESGVERWRLGAFLEGQLALLYEQGEYGSQVDEAIARYRALKFRPVRAPFHRRLFWVLQAWARLAQLRRGGSEAAVEEAVEELRQAASTEVFRGHLLAVEAGLAFHRRQEDRALTLIAEAEEVALAHDAPWIRFEATLLRARILGGEAGKREARIAQVLAAELGWSGRARRVTREFALSAAPGVSDSGSLSERGAATHLKLERQLAALLQVSRACASVLHPDRVAEVALDQIVKILGAERALLFLATDDGSGERLVPRAARAAPGAEGVDLEDYSRTVVQRVWLTRQPLVLSSIEDEASLGAHSVVVHELRSILAVPLVVRDAAIGVVYVDNRLARGIFNGDDVQILAALATQIGTALETARAVQLEIERKELANDLERAYHQATTDALTGLRNRRFLDERIDNELSRAARTGRPFSVILLDVDHFKAVNDTWGHLVGDRVLVEVASVLGSMVRSSDLAARYGGEEFCVLLPDTGAAGAAQVAERMREALQGRRIQVEGGEITVTASFGVTTWAGGDRASVYRAADEALYVAKASGRNQVHVGAPSAAA